MITMTKEIQESVLDYLQDDGTLPNYSDNFYAFYYRCMQADMSPFDADRYAILNTLFHYDIGMENARAIDNWMYDHDTEINFRDIYDLTNSEEDKTLLENISKELNLNLDFTNWIQEDYKHYDFFEE